ncbi:hypothetical protein V5O48_018332 [Marasmius crinis-equi]|uniref:NmrA-like domain-containing protein n=2 Tax=Marasmius crinis-equi TaxID=585013 RepID=A0ABR3ELL0_9AGAR
MSFKNIALFGANGQIGDSIIRALLQCEHQKFQILAFIPPGSQLNSGESDDRVTVRDFNLNDLNTESLAQELQGVQVAISAVGGKALEAQTTIQDAAAKAAVQRYYPSEYGMHHIYRKSGDPQGYIHPMWDTKARHTEDAVLHHAVLSGKMSYTVIGCGDFYNQDREKIWCPWTQTDVDEYVLHIFGNPNAKADFTHLDDFAKYLVATLLEPEKSKNQYMNFTSDNISYNDIASLLEKYSGKPVRKEIRSLYEVHEVLADPSRAAKGLEESAFPVDFWYLVKGLQGEGRFRRPPGQSHNRLFPSIKPTTFEEYFRERFGK